ncbi:MAG: NAD-dependent epimerase/dehydratase family protein [Deltaproteobacteria bacterium]|nr:NAD-dependent epimerase/dehydratase family protein [Deltaproteobacteria bacterium]
MSHENNEKQTIVITGGAGFVGSNLTRRVKSAGYPVEILSRTTGTDLLNLDQTTSFFEKVRPSIVIHCAADVGGIAYGDKHPVQIFENNMLMGMNLVKAMNRVGVKGLINIMPNCIYPGHLTLYKEEEWWNGPIHPSVLAYGLPRKALWGLCEAYKKENGFKSAHLVFPNMYGPGDHMDPVRSHALGGLIQKICLAKKNDQKTVEIWGTGRPIREWMYVEDAAEAIRLALQSFPTLHETIVNVGIGKGISVLESAQIIAKTVGWNGDFVFNTSYPDGAAEKRLDSSLFKRLFHWEPPTPLREGIEKTIDWYRSLITPDRPQ